MGLFVGGAVAVEELGGEQRADCILGSRKRRTVPLKWPSPLFPIRSSQLPSFRSVTEKLFSGFRLLLKF